MNPKNRREFLLYVHEQPESDRDGELNVTNAGSVAGADVAQVYVGIPSRSTQVQEPPKQLKAFVKISPKPWQISPTNQITLNMRLFAYWDVASESWVVAPGTYQILVGDSSRNAPLQTTVTIQ